MIEKARMYLKYFIIIIYIKNIISYNEANYQITRSILHFHKIITASILLFIIYLSEIKYYPLALLISIILIIYLDKFHNNIEKFYQNEGFSSDQITIRDVLKYYKQCMNNNWSTENCKSAKESITDLCQQNLKVGECPPWGKNEIKRNGIKIPIDCPKIYKDLNPGECD